MIKYNLIGYKRTLFDFGVRKTINLVLKSVEKVENVDDDHVVSFILVDKETIHKINREYRNVDRPTDVISFAEIDDLSNLKRELPYDLGSIYICVDKVYEQANEYGHSVFREFSFLVTHGMLHLLGYDHMEKEDEIKMFARQDEILNLAKIYR